MALSFEESKKMLAKQMATPAVMSLRAETPSVMTLDLNEPIAAYAGDDGNWTTDNNYKHSSAFYDGNMSEISATKDINLDGKQFNISQESNAQYIPFEMPMRYDNFDLSKTAISIHYETSNNYHGESVPINVQYNYNTERIRFGWLIPKEATQSSGRLKFEIHATGSIPDIVDENNEPLVYIWKTKPNDTLNVLQSLCGTNCLDGKINIDDTWVKDIVTAVAGKVAEQIANAQVGDQVTAAQNAALAAQTAAANAQSAVTTALANYSTTTEMKAHVAQEIANADIEGKLTAYAKTDDVNKTLEDYALKTNIPTKASDLENDVGYITEHQSLDDYATIDYVNEEIENIDVSDRLGDLGDDEAGHPKTVKQYVDEAVDAVDVSEQLKEYAKTADVSATMMVAQEQIDTNTNNISSISTKVSTNETDIGILTSNAMTLSTKITGLEDAMKDMGDQAGYEYYATYGKTILEATGEETDNVFTLYEIDGDTESVKSQFIITGGSGGGSGTATTTLTVTRVTASPLIITPSDKAIIEFNCTSYDTDGETVDCSYTWKKGSSSIMSGSLAHGLNTFDLSEYVTTGTHKFTLTVTDEGGSMAVKTWTIQKVDVRIESTFNDKTAYVANKTVNFTYTPYGSVAKTIHFKLDGVELDPVVTTASGLLQSYVLPAQSHGAHLLEVWMTATVNNTDIETPHIYKDIIWYDQESVVPVIGCIYRYDYYGMVEARQYNTTEIVYTVYDPSAENPTVVRYVNGSSIGEQILEVATDIWSYKTAEIGEKTLSIQCGATSVEIKLDVVELGIDIEPVTANLAFDFNPTGYSNNDADRIWSDSNTNVTMSVSDNFDWTNGGYQRDDNGDTYFCVKAGTTATINYHLFGDSYDPKATGKEFKFVFKTTNVKKRSATFLSCIDGETPIGIDMKVENAKIYASNKELFIPYCEEDIIEFEFNINKNADIPMMMTYEDGVANRPLIYASDSSFMQLTPKPIIIGSDDCDVHVYRMKAYDTSLTDKEILTNFIADARNADEMISRYNRNQIYDENNALTPEVLAEKCPDLRIIMIDAPWFTNDKDDKVGNTTVRQIYKGGDAVLDNWTCTGASHSGQGTSSNKYGYAGRNLRLIMDNDDSLFTFNGTNEDGSPITGKTVTLTRTSVPNAYFNIKVNIASSENQNNAQFARRYNEFNPIVSPAKVNNSMVKDTMEFYNCVVFIRENEEDLTKHREFNDTAWHFYAIGNIGDDKKTDKTRMNDSKDPRECVVEIADFDVPLAEFPTGIGGRYIAPNEFVAGNTAYDNLYSAYTYDEDGKFKAFGAESYEFRYEMKGITDEQRQVNIDTWREFYKFVVTSTDEEFVSNIENYFVLDSALYYYLFTERYLMVDNRAKNSFWHYGKCTDGVYRWDLCFGYDFDTSLGIDNTGKLVLTYGQEDVDKDSSGAYIYRAAESNFFCRIRDLFVDRLKGMFQSRESLGAWSSTSLINQWDKAQSQFPEELWRLDIERKYIRTYRGVSVDNSIQGAQNPMFLEPMLNGRKKYQRRQFERNQELYMATKYVSTFARDDFIRLRFSNPIDPVVKQDYTLYLTPYTDMYIAVEFGNTAPIVFRAKAGVEYPVQRETASDTADIVLIYGASFIQAIGDLSKCYLGDNDFSKASRLQSLVIGSNVAGYENTFMTGLALGNNKLLEYLDIRNITGLNSVVDLSQCENLVELRAEGSGATGVIFANGGKLKKAYIPAVTSITMKNLNNLEVFDVASYTKLQQLIVENIQNINTYTMVDLAKSLNTVRLVGINWNKDFGIQNTAILDRLCDMRGVDGNGYGTGKSVVTGYMWVASGKDREIAEFNELWPYLTIEADATTKQVTVTFVNDDGTILDVQYVDVGSAPVNPISRLENPIAVPTKESTISTNYTFSGWNSEMATVWSDKTIRALYSETTREYIVKYVANNNILQTSTAPYGSIVMYTGDIPIYTAGESSYKYYLFDSWDKFGYVDGDKTINAIFDSCEYVDDYFVGKELKDLRPVELYMMTKLDPSIFSIRNYIDPADVVEIQLGNDIDYKGISSEVIIENTTFNGTNKMDTNINLMDEDRDFVLAIDFKMNSSNSANAVLAQCYDSYDSTGFQIVYNNAEVQLKWGTNSHKIANVNCREMVVIRHIKGESGVHVYSSETVSDAPKYIELTGQHAAVHDLSLVFGCSKIGENSYRQYGSGVVYWSKVWYADLSNSVCENLAYWPHEKINCEVCCTPEEGNPLLQYALSDERGYSSFTFIAKNALSQPVMLHTYSNNSNAGGWATYRLNGYLNNRVYNAFPDKWKQLIKPVNVKSTAGNKSTDIASSRCHIFIPSVAELGLFANNSGYISELTMPNSTISHCLTRSQRVCYNYDGASVPYWTRSPNLEYSTYVHSITADGDVYNYYYPYQDGIYARIMFSI